MTQNMRLYGLRGAVCCTENTKQAIQQAVSELAVKLFKLNTYTPENIVSIQFTITEDLTALNPAAALRKSPVAALVSTCALFCSTEPPIDGGLPRTIRVLITAYGEQPPVHVYTGGAEVLRPDFIHNSSLQN